MLALPAATAGIAPAVTSGGAVAGTLRRTRSRNARAVSESHAGRLPADAAREQPDHPALLFKGATVTYGRARTAAATRVRRRSIRSASRRGDRVALLLPNCPQFFIAEFGAWKIGADRRTAQSDLHGARARRAAARSRHRDHRHAHAVLRARQEHPAADGAPARDRDEHQGTLPAGRSGSCSRCSAKSATAIA